MLKSAAAVVVALAGLWCGAGKVLAQEGGCTRARLGAADRQVERVLTGQVAAEEATAAYLALLHCAGTAGDDALDSLLRPHVARTMLLLPDSVRRRVMLDPHAARTSAFHPGAGALLATWWRRQDPLPATARNERLEEHLTRLAHALPRYASAERVTGLDDRGVVYVRLGPPEQRHQIRFDDARFRRDVFRFGVAVDPQDFPENALWLYPSIDRAGYFLFVRRGAAFYLGSTADLVPPSLSDALGTSERDMNVAVSLLAALRYIYGQLALYHIDFAERFAQVERYALWQESQQIAAEAGLAPPLGQRDAEVGAGREARQVYADPTLGIEAPAAFVQEVMTQSAHADRQAVRRRAALPRQHAAPVEERAAAGALPMALRTARFLAEDGTTRLEVYWSPLPGGLGTGSSTLIASAALLDGGYRRRRTQTERLALTMPEVADAVLPPQTMAVPLGPVAEAGPPRVRLQWDQHDATGRLLRRAVRRLDELQPLNADPAHLEMSDLRPVFWSADAPVPDDPTEALPYPFDGLTSHTALALVFDVYHLTYGADDRTCTRVSYEVEQDDQRLAAGTAQRTDPTRRVRDVVVIEPQAWRGARHVLLRIRVQDCVSGEQAARTLAFEVRS